VDLVGEIAQFTSGGYGTIPENIRRSFKELELIDNYFSSINYFSEINLSKKLHERIILSVIYQIKIYRF
jgi:hypothetical protein